MTDPQQPARAATTFGEPFGLRCKYEYDRIKRKFLYRFYRRGNYIGCTADPKKVVSLMERFATAK